MPDRLPLGQAPRPLRRRLGWFVLLWLCGVGAVTLVGLAIRWVLAP